MKRLYRKAGAPDGVCTNLSVAKEQVGEAIEDPRVGRVALTGSTEAGAAVASRAGTVTEAIQHGARATGAGEPAPATGAFVRPTILTGVTSANPVYRQELFGPVVMFFRGADEDEGIAIANDTGYGLGASVFTGGVEMSGYGRELSRLGIQEFVNKKLIDAVLIDAPPRATPVARCLSTSPGG